MASKVSGNIRGLAVSQLRQAERIYSRRVGRHELISLDLAREIYHAASSLRRRLGVLISREGYVEEVFLGSREILYLPELGRYRLGKGRLRRLRLVFSDLSAEPAPQIPPDIYTDLESLRLDAVVSVKVLGNRTPVTYAYINPGSDAENRSHTEWIPELSQCALNFSEFIGALEGEMDWGGEPAVVGKPKALLVGVYEKGSRGSESSMAELEELARSAGLSIAGQVVQKRPADPRTLLGKGKLEEVVLHCQRLGADMLVFDTELKPSQWRAITNSTALKVIDRSMLILDIFAQRATSSEGRLQVELAQLKYNLPRLVEMDSGLSRLTGGIGGRGPGETKLEISRRRIRDRIIDLDRRISKITEGRQLKRRRREASELPLVAILGYTNVGKSSLFNKLTRSNVIAENKLFATLDPAQRRMVRQTQAGELRTVILSDTVGFIRNLPAELINAFRATLEELDNASLLVHVIDASDPEHRQRKEAVERILESMKLGGIAVINVVNKVDKIPRDEAEIIARGYDAVGVSAKTGEGLEELVVKIWERLDRKTGSDIFAPSFAS